MVYSPLFRDFRPEKRYGGGQANDLFIFDLEDQRRQAHHRPPARRPRPDVDRRHDLLQLRSRRHVQPLCLRRRARRRPRRSRRSTHLGRPLAQLRPQRPHRLRAERRAAGARHEDRQEHGPLDHGAGRRRCGSARRACRPPGQIEDFELSPKGERALFAARGDIFTAPIEKGADAQPDAHRPARTTSGRAGRPTARSIAFISDRSGEEELYVIAQDGSGKRRAADHRRQGDALPARVVAGRQAHRLQRQGRQDLRLHLRRQEAHRDRRRAARPGARLRLVAARHSPRLQHDRQPTASASIYIWSAGDGQLRRVTDELFNAENPAWDPDGNYLFYLSDREFAPQISAAEFNYATNRTTGIFALALRKDVKHPFPPESDEVTVDRRQARRGHARRRRRRQARRAPAKPGEAAKADDAAKPAARSPQPAADLVIDFDGLAPRVARVPLEADNYDGLSGQEGPPALRASGPPSTTAGRPIGSRRCASTRSRTARRRRWSTTWAATRCRRTARRCSCARAGAFTLYDATPAGAHDEEDASRPRA